MRVTTYFVEKSEKLSLNRVLTRILKIGVPETKVGVSQCKFEELLGKTGVPSPKVGVKNSK